jgi:hypothetical protein
METIIKCAHCGDDINTEDDIFYGSEINGNEYCETCHHADMEDASTVMLAGPDYEHDIHGEPIRILVGDWFIEDRWSETFTDLDIKRQYRSTNAWRGYYETTIDGWTEVLSGWTTGGWGDPTAERKQAFNEWAESLFTGAITPPVNVAVITDRTSNVFSIAIGVFVPEADAETFTEWMNGELDNLRYALS